MSQQRIEASSTLLVSGKSVWLTRRAPSARVFPNLWEGPTGKRELGESTLECAARETWEEAGLIIEPSSFLYSGRIFTHGPGLQFARVDLFMVKLSDHQIPKRMEPEKQSHWHLVDANIPIFFLSPATGSLLSILNAEREFS